MADDDGARVPERFSIIDRIYELLDMVEEDLRKLQHLRDSDVMFYDGIVQAVNFLEDTGYGGRLGLSAMDLSKFRRWRGEVERTTISKVGQRAQTLLHEMEGEAKQFVLDNPTEERTKPDNAIQNQADREAVPAVQPIRWVALPRRANAELIADISALLDESVFLARANNLPPDKSALTDLERAQLIALLETTLALLKAPLVEKGMLKKMAEAARSGATSAVQKKTEFALGYALGKLGEALVKLLGYL